MQVIVGDIFNYHSNYWMVIPTNIGWTKDGRNVMGAGIAKVAKHKFPGIDEYYGKKCRAGERSIVPFIRYRLIFFPTKRLNEAKPYLSWQNASDFNLIEACLFDLVHLVEDNQIDVAIPLVGTGNSKLDPNLVWDLFIDYLVSDRFLVVVNKSNYEIYKNKISSSNLA